MEQADEGFREGGRVKKRFSGVRGGRVALSLIPFGLWLSCALPTWAKDSGTLPREGWSEIARVPLPGAPTRFDYQSLDPGTERLYLAHLGDGSLVVVDTRAQKVAATVSGFPNVHGVLAVPEIGKVYATVSLKSRRSPGSLVVVDTRDLRVLARIPTGIHPDGLDYDTKTGRLFVSNEWGRSLSVIDTLHNHIMKTIPLGGEVGNTRADQKIHRVFATVQTRNVMVRIDPFSLHVDRTYRLSCRHPHGLAIDGETQMAYVACEGDSRVLVVDLGTGKVSANLPTGRTPDVLSLDASRHLLFVASESGVVTVYRVNGKTLELLSRANLGLRAHSILVDPATHRVYLPLENAEGHPVLEILEYGQR